MSKILKLVFIAIFGLSMLGTVAFADSGKGQKIFIKDLKGPCGMDGGTMAKRHTQSEWKELFESGKLNSDLEQKCPGMKPIKDSYLEHIYDFLYNFASDSGNVPAC